MPGGLLPPNRWAAIRCPPCRPTLRGNVRTMAEVVLGLGIDLVELERVERALDALGPAHRRAAHGPARSRDACPPSRRRAPRAFATAIAVKEAASKALGTGWTPGRELARRGAGGGPRGPRAAARRRGAQGGRAGRPGGAAHELTRARGARHRGGLAAFVSLAGALAAQRGGHGRHRLRGLHRLRLRDPLPAALRAPAGRARRARGGALGGRPHRRGAAAGRPAWRRSGDAWPTATATSAWPRARSSPTWCCCCSRRR